MADQPIRPSRRDLLRGALAAGLAAGADPAEADADANAAAPANATTVENARPGHRDWQLTRVRLEKSGGCRSAVIEGYCSRQSVTAGETIDFHVSADPPVDYRLDIFRMGYYGGAGARLVHSMEHSVRNVGTKPTPEAGPRRVRECGWPVSYSVPVPDDWPSGVYLGRLTTLGEHEGSGYWQSFTVFVVRDRPGVRRDVLFQVSDNTWQAYNKWPGDDSLYTDPRGAHTPNVAVSFDRPYGKYPQIFEAPQSVGSGEFLLWEYPLCYWLEQHGYDVGYCSNVDVVDPAVPQSARAFLSVGHDEYWDLRQFESLVAARDAGVNLLFLSANTAYMVSPFTASGDGRANRVITRAASFGPLSEAEVQSCGHLLGPFPYAGPDEATLIGARTTVPFNGGGDWICTRPEHWLFADTGMQQGDRIPGLVGWEYHGEPADIPGLEVVGAGTVLSGGTKPGRWTATIYPGPRGNFVFNAATIFWSQGLSSPPGHMLPWSHWSRPHGPDPRVQQITHNLLRRALRHDA